LLSFVPSLHCSSPPPLSPPPPNLRRFKGPELNINHKYCVGPAIAYTMSTIVVPHVPIGFPFLLLSFPLSIGFPFLLLIAPPFHRLSFPPTYRPPLPTGFLFLLISFHLFLPASFPLTFLPSPSISFPSAYFPSPSSCKLSFYPNFIPPSCQLSFILLSFLLSLPASFPLHIFAPLPTNFPFLLPSCRLFVPPSFQFLSFYSSNHRSYSSFLSSLLPTSIPFSSVYSLLPTSIQFNLLL
jgi:hypothetical protein